MAIARFQGVKGIDRINKILEDIPSIQIYQTLTTREIFYKIDTRYSLTVYQLYAGYDRVKYWDTFWEKASPGQKSFRQYVSLFTGKTGFGYPSIVFQDSQGEILNIVFASYYGKYKPSFRHMTYLYRYDKSELIKLFDRKRKLESIPSPAEAINKLDKGVKIS
jgi:hypothetical protein